MIANNVIVIRSKTGEGPRADRNFDPESFPQYSATWFRCSF